MSTFTTNVGLEVPAHGSDPNSWDTPVNADWVAIDAVFGNTTTINAVAASGTVTLTQTQYRPRIFIITGALSADVNYQLPSGKGGQWTIYNNTSNAQTITFSSAGGGTTVVLLQGYVTQVYCDGTNVALGNTRPGAAAGSNTQVQFNSSGSLAGSPSLIWTGSALGIGVAVPGATLSVLTSFRIYGSSSGYVGFVAPASAGNTSYTLPSADGTNGQCLTTNGSAVLSWTTVGGGSAGVTSFSGGSTGLTPVSPGTGAVTLGGTLAVANGGTGATTVAGNPLLAAANNWTALQNFTSSLHSYPNAAVYASNGSTSGFIFFGVSGYYVGYDGSKYTWGGSGSAADVYFPNNAYATAFVNTSDYRVKRNIIPLPFVGRPSDRMRALAPKVFDLVNADGAVVGHRIEGFIAHELAEVVPGAVVGLKDAVDHNKTPILQGVDASKLVPLLVATVQELLTRVADLESRSA